MNRIILLISMLLTSSQIFCQKDADIFQRAVEKGLSGDHKGAIADYTIVLRTDPDNTKVYFLRAMDKSILGDFRGALADFSKILKLEPANYDALMRSGELYALLNN